MNSKPKVCISRPSKRFVRRSTAACVLTLSLAATGCLSRLQKRSADVAAATTPVIDQAAAAYRTANSVYDLRVDYDAYSFFDRKTPVYKPSEIRPLLTRKDIAVRVAVLAAFQAYVQSVVAIANGGASPAVDVAAKNAGKNLTSLGNDLAPTVESTFGLAVPTSGTTTTTVTTTTTDSSTTTSSTVPTPADPITPAIGNGLSTAVDALGKFLIAHIVKRELPAKIQAMDASLQILCTLLERDIDVLDYQEHIDYDSIINRQTLFLRANEKLDPQVRREEIMKLPEMVRQQRANRDQLALLRISIAKLAVAHKALADEAADKTPETFKEKLADLEAAGEDLGKFYSSQPTT